MPTLLLRCSTRQDVKATFFVPGFTAECYPEVVRAIADAGHEIGHHGYLHEQMQGIDRQNRGAATSIGGSRALRNVAGVTPVGYRAPWWEMNWHTAQGCSSDRGFLYDSSLLDGDAPYRFAVAPGSSSTPRSKSRWTGHWTTGNSTRSTPGGPAAASSRIPSQGP